ncbi:MAG: ABC transporter permease subunit [Candidatus Thioglobus sp.]|nr:MAG: ABC transporter permease subunit [Candidatus Thioglobus sp.]
MGKIKPDFAFFYNNKIRAILFQTFALAAIAYIFYSGYSNFSTNVEIRGIQTGFDFLSAESGFDIAEFLIDYSSNSSNLRVFYVGLINTVVVSIIGIIFASIIGLIIGVARLSNNWLIAKLAGGYVELFRNIPILLQILFWYNLILAVLPNPKNSFEFFGAIFINLRGIYLPKPIFADGFIWVILALIIGIVLRVAIKRHFANKKALTGLGTNTLAYSLLMIIGLPVLVYFSFGMPIDFDYPALKGFNFKGGSSLSPEFFALAFALSVYTATYIAEAIRTGIESVPVGQKEAALALGLTPRQSLKLIILPQALKVAIPPIINQYLNLTKNSSLATAIGYPEIMSVFAGTVLNQAGQAVEIILMTMAVYLLISLVIATILNIVNRRMNIKGTSDAGI